MFPSEELWPEETISPTSRISLRSFRVKPVTTADELISAWAILPLVTLLHAEAEFVFPTVYHVEMRNTGYCRNTSCRLIVSVATGRFHASGGLQPCKRNVGQNPCRPSCVSFLVVGKYPPSLYRRRSTFTRGYFSPRKHGDIAPVVPPCFLGKPAPPIVGHRLI